MVFTVSSWQVFFTSLFILIKATLWFVFIGHYHGAQSGEFMQINQFMNIKFMRICVWVLFITQCASLVFADEPNTEEWNAKFQSTYIWQEKPAFNAQYSGHNSLSADKEYSYSFTATAALGVRLWDGAELYLDPELAQGVPFSNLTGLGGYPNGEMARTSGPELTAYRARLFLRQTWNQGGEQEAVDSAANQLAGNVDTHRWVLTLGNLSVTDIFDNNSYNHDPRTQFLNWSLMTYGAYDFAADARGYTRGVALEWYNGNWVARVGRFLEPLQPNQQLLDSDFLHHYGDQIELENSFTLNDEPGKFRVLAFRNKMKMSLYQDALALAEETQALPDINLVRHGDQIKCGVGINLEQAITHDLGLFGRVTWADGATETYAFTEIDRSLSVGVLLQGTAWNRENDHIGLALVTNNLSKLHKQYLENGGLGFFIGDGQLDYRPENIAEGFYSLSLFSQSSLSLDYQYIANPAYNAARGPAMVYSVRMHTEF